MKPQNEPIRQDQDLKMCKPQDSISNLDSNLRLIEESVMGEKKDLLQASIAIVGQLVECAQNNEKQTHELKDEVESNRDKILQMDRQKTLYLQSISDQHKEQSALQEMNAGLSKTLDTQFEKTKILSDEKDELEDALTNEKQLQSEFAKQIELLQSQLHEKIEENQKLQETVLSKDSIIEEKDNVIKLKDKEIKIKEKESSTDSLTGLPNRRVLDMKLKSTYARAKRYKESFTLLAIDLDFFKNVNDTQGHDAGDNVLKIVARIFRSVIRESDFPARCGGDEFSIIAEKTDIGGAAVLASKLHEAISKSGLPVRFSIGMSEYNGKRNKVLGERNIAEFKHSLKDLIKSTDNAVYLSKKNGRDRTSVESAVLVDYSSWWRNLVIKTIENEDYIESFSLINDYKAKRYNRYQKITNYRKILDDLVSIDINKRDKKIIPSNNNFLTSLSIH